VIRGAACARCLPIGPERPDLQQHQRPWCRNTGDILCEGYICGQRCCDAKRPYAWDFLDASRPAGHRCAQASTSRLISPTPTPAINHGRPRHQPAFAPVMAIWLRLGDISGLQSARPAAPQPRAEAALVSLCSAGGPGGGGGAGGPMAPGLSGALVQPQLGREGVVLALKPNRVLVHQSR